MIRVISKILLALTFTSLVTTTALGAGNAKDTIYPDPNLTGVFPEKQPLLEDAPQILAALAGGSTVNFISTTGESESTYLTNSPQMSTKGTKGDGTDDRGETLEGDIGR